MWRQKPADTRRERYRGPVPGFGEQPRPTFDRGASLRSIKSECLSKIIPLGERHLRSVVSEYAAHYHLERNHQGLDNRLIKRAQGQPPDVGRIACRERLGGVLKFYYREAA